MFRRQLFKRLWMLADASQGAGCDVGMQLHAGRELRRARRKPLIVVRNLAGHKFLRGLADADVVKLVNHGQVSQGDERPLGL